MIRRTLAAAACALLMTIPAQAALAPGTPAPVFATQGALNGKVVNVDLKRLLSRGPVVLYFFPAAFTPGCNAEAKMFADANDKFRALGATVVGMSADPVDRLQKFSVEHCAGRFAVASATPAVLKGYDVELTAGGRTISNRTSYVISPQGRIVHAHSEMSAANHVSETLGALERWKAAQR